MLKNPEPTIIPDPFPPTKRPKGGEEERIIDPKEGPIQLAFADLSQGERPPRYYFQFTNQSGLDLHAACLYLNQQFGIEVDFFNPSSLEARTVSQSIWTLNGKPIELRKPGYLDTFGWKEEVLYFLLILSTTPFKVDTLCPA